MNDKIITTHNGQEHTFSTYFVINNEKLFSTNNFNFEDNLEDCFYIKRIGSNTHPKIYLDIKENNEWITKNQFIGDYYSLIDFIAENQNSFICIRGFSRATIGQIIRMINVLKGINVAPIRYYNKENPKVLSKRLK